MFHKYKMWVIILTVWKERFAKLIACRLSINKKIDELNI